MVPNNDNCEAITQIIYAEHLIAFLASRSLALTALRAMLDAPVANSIEVASAHC